MSIPTQAQLYAEVDRQFAIAQPDAPTRLDPENRSHEAWVAEWLAIRDAVLNEWTDFVFAEHFPHAGTLDPSNPEHSTLIEYWRDIQHQICNGEGGKYNWDNPQTPPPPPLSVLSVVRDDDQGGFVLVFSNPVAVDEAGDFLWPGRNALPVGVTVERRSDNAVHVRVTIESLQTMRDEVAKQIIDEGLLTAD